MILLDMVDNFFRVIPRFTKSAAWEKCPISTGIDDHLYLYGGSVAALFEIEGAQKDFFGAGYKEKLESLTRSLNSLLKRDGIILEFTFVRDKAQTSTAIEKQLVSMRESARQNKVDLDFLIDEKRDVLSEYVLHEKAYLSIIVTSAALPPDQRKVTSSIGSGSQTSQGFSKVSNILAVAYGIEESVVNSLSSSFAVVVKKLSAKSAVSVLRSLWDADLARDKHAEFFEPVFFDDIARCIKPEGRSKKISADAFLPPSVGRQIFVREAKDCDSAGVFKMGNLFYSSGYFEIPSGNPQPFNDILRIFPTEKISSEIPYRINFRIFSGNGMASTSMKRMSAQLLNTAQMGKSVVNQMIMKGLDALKAMELKGIAICRTQISVTTWAQSEELSITNIARVMGALNNWGGGIFVPEYGSPFLAAVGTLPLHRSPADMMVVPVPFIVPSLPIQRPWSPWKRGSIVLTSEDGKMLPYQAGSSLQTAWVDVVVGPMGSGKSVLLNILNMSNIFSPNQQRLPRAAILDVGYSSQGTIELIREVLPPELRHMAVHYRMRNDLAHSMNIFDTPLGCRYPPDDDKAFLVSFLAILMTPVGADRAPEGTTELADRLVSICYEYFDKKYPKDYEKGVEPRVDAVLEKHRLEVDGSTSWWEAVDQLFDLGEIEAAIIAQRHAVPIIPDVAMVMNSTQSIMDAYKNAKNPNSQESLISFYTRQLQSVVERFPSLSNPTRLDFGNARIIAVDLSDVTSKTGDAALQQSELMYMASRAFLARGYYGDEESAQRWPTEEKYLSYHRADMRQTRKDKKILVYDELHNVSSPLMLNWLETDIRVGRKYNIHIVMASQRDTDFSAAIMELSSNIWILRAEEDAIERLQKCIKLSDYAVHSLRESLKGYGKALLFSKTKEGNLERVVQIKTGSAELWAYATTPIDISCRKELTRQIGFKKAVYILSKEFPSGSIKSRIEDLLDQGHGYLKEDDAVKKLTNDLVQKYR